MKSPTKKEIELASKIQFDDLTNQNLQLHKRMGQFLKNTLAMAHQKGLQVKRNQFQVGWTITLKNGSIHSAPNNADMVAFVRGY